MNRVEEWVMQNRSQIEKGVEIIGQSCEVLAGTVGQLHPILEAVFVAASELLSNPDGQEARYLAEQFGKVNQKLEGIKAEIDQISREIQRTSMNKQHFDFEAHMLSQYDTFQAFVNSKPEFRKKKMEKFLKQYENTEGDLNIDALYNAVTGENLSGDHLLVTVVATEQRSRRAVEDFCARLKKLFVVGIIAVMGYASLKDGAIGEGMVKKWQERMEIVENHMKAAVDDCIQNFATQAKMDMESELLQNPGSVDSQFTKSLLDILARKYDWVSWSVQVFSHNGLFLWNWLAGKKCYGSSGNNCFDILTKNNMRVMVSFSAAPRQINKPQIQAQIERQKIKGDMEDAAQSLGNSLPSCVVHAVSQYKEVAESNNFQVECYYSLQYKKAYLCFHSD
ncbi:rapunzel 5 [Brienomyrus brachyistius]|uniref:rapunzel 5 n=1 Tax=Brienomyrus brachyistius TaxID=42636 RepID=UPI0020B3FE85|nr:rapunzel 5 [Brienomyrus brachyistius]XP_048882186.1 rapunzel 5 [Brienomyrus brachyistius]